MAGDARAVARLSRQAAVDAGLRLIDTRGLDALSMRNVAAEVGCPVMSLYRHVASKEDLEDAIVQHLVGGVEVVAPQPTWDGLMRGWAAAYRDMVRAHPNVAPLIGARPAAGYAAQRDGAELILGLLQEAGDTQDGAVRHLRTALMVILGYCHFEVGTGTPAPPGATEHLAASGFPRLAGLVGRIGQDGDALFALMLDMVVGGIARDLS